MNDVLITGRNIYQLWFETIENKFKSLGTVIFVYQRVMTCGVNRILNMLSNQIIKWKQTYNLCVCIFTLSNFKSGTNKWGFLP